MKKCLKCNVELPDSMSFCSNCGEQLVNAHPPVASFCPKCGQKNESGGAFCSGCGASLSINTAAETPVNNAYIPTPQPQPQPTYQSSASQSHSSTATYTAQRHNWGEPTVTVNPVFAFLKSFAMSPLFLIAACAFSASVLITFIGNLVATSGLFDTVKSVLDMAGLGRVSAFDGVYDMMDSLENSVVIGVLIGMAPQILTVVGIWMMFANLYTSRREEDLQSSGLRLIRVIMVINRVIMWVILIGIEILLFLVVLGAGSQNNGSDIAGFVILVLMAIIGAILYFFIYYYNKIIDMIDNFVYVVDTRLPVFGGITFVAVFSMIVGSLNALSAISSADTLGGMSTVGLLASAAASICFGIVLFRFNSEISNIRRESQLDL